MRRFRAQVRRTVGVAAAAVVLATLALPSAAGAVVPAGNLIQNPGADEATGETDSTGIAIPQWVTVGHLSAVKYGAAGFPTVPAGMSIGGGANFFSGGKDDSTSTGEQTIDVAAAQAEIDAGRVSVTLSAYLGGRFTEVDNARVTASFEDPSVSDFPFGTLQVGPVSAADRGNQTILLPRSATAHVPVGTRLIRVTITATRTGPPQNDGYADNLSLTLDIDPVAMNDTATVGEDASATAVNVLANDTNTDGGPKRVVSVSQPAHGTVAITGGGSGLTYKPDADYCNSQPGGVADAFTYALNGGSSATVAVTVTCVDDAPVAVGDTATVGKDAAPTAVDVLANDTDVDGGPKQVVSAAQPAHGTVAITGGGAGLTYKPTAGYCNTQPGGTADTFTYALNGGSSASVAVTVTCVDQPPVAVNDTKTVAQDADAAPIDVLANDTNPDGGPKQITAATQPAHGTVAITGGGTGLTYKPAAGYCNSQPGGTADTFAYTLNGGSTATVAVTVTCVDQPPSAAGCALAAPKANPTGTATKTITGTPAGDQLLGTQGPDRIQGLAGDDCILGLADNDLIDAGAGDDRVAGDGLCPPAAAFSFCFSGGTGNDRIFGGTGNDTISGNSGNDAISGQSDDDRLRGDAGNDKISGGSGRDILTGNTGNDNLTGSDGNDRLSGGTGRDRLSGGGGSDQLDGGTGNDTIKARDGAKDHITCGSGKDKVTADRLDKVKSDCEHVSRR